MFPLSTASDDQALRSLEEKVRSNDWHSWCYGLCFVHSTEDRNPRAHEIMYVTECAATAAVALLWQDEYGDITLFSWHARCEVFPAQPLERAKLTSTG